MRLFGVSFIMEENMAIRDRPLEVLFLYPFLEREDV